MTAMAGSAAAAGLSGPRVLGGGFNFPDAVSSDGTHVWVANDRGNGSVIETDAATGAVVKVISGQRDQAPTAISSDGTHVWVVNARGSNSVTELDAATGRPGAGDLRFQLRVQHPCRRLLRRHPRVGGQPSTR